MHPDPVLLTDVCYGDERIKGTINRGAGCGADKERHISLRDRNQPISPVLPQRPKIRGSDYSSRETPGDTVIDITFCLASTILLSRSDGIILPLQERRSVKLKSYGLVIITWLNAAVVKPCICCDHSDSPLINFNTDDTFCTDSKSGCSFLDWEMTLKDNDSSVDTML